MSQFFNVEIASEVNGVVTLLISFGDTAGSNTQIVPDAIAAISALKLSGGHGIHFNGRASLPVAMALAHAVAHLYEYVACFDPKLQGYVVAISHHATIRPGELLPSVVR